MSERCCDDCHNSHGDCIERGSCLCHAGVTGRLFFGSQLEAADAGNAIRTGKPYKARGAACRFEGGSMATFYPEGAETMRAVMRVEVTGTVVEVEFGDARSR